MTMKEAAHRNNVVCRVKTHKLLVRFKERSPLIPANVQEQRGRPRTPRYSKEEKNVSDCSCTTFAHVQSLHVFVVLQYAAEMIKQLMGVTRAKVVEKGEASSTSQPMPVRCTCFGIECKS